jgi:sugar phosphate isomerase/epimerase
MAVSTISLAGMGTALAAGPGGAGGGGGRKLGLVIHSLWHRWQGDYSSVKIPPLKEAVEVLDHCRELGCGGLQTTVKGWTLEEARQLRETVESAGLYLEGSIELPKEAGDVDRFEREARRAGEAGVTVFRSYLGGRRYEDLKDMAAVKRYRDVALRRLMWAEPVLRRQGVRLGVENHKDLRADELVELLRTVGSAQVGCCLDFGNNLALLEAPEQTLSALGPYLVTTHLKDMAVAPAAQGFEMAEVPLGQGILDLPGLMAACVAANPAVTFNLEMITRDPLTIPCLEARYWDVMQGVPGSALAEVLRLTRNKAAAKLERVGSRNKEALCIWEAEQNQACAEQAFKALGLERHGTA